jgi:hypothetical protein
MCAPKESEFMGHACLKNFGFGRLKMYEDVFAKN